jgi:hypothetical protein
MDDELNIDPRETDYLDDYNMEKMANFFELEKQLTNLGFQDDKLTNRLKEFILSDRLECNIQHREVYEHLSVDYWYNLNRSGIGKPVRLNSYDTAMYQHGTMNIAYRSFAGTLSKDNACQVLSKQIIESLPEEEVSVWILTDKGVKDYLNDNNPRQINFFEKLNQKHMNTENLSYLKKQLLNLGFGEKLNDELEKNIKSGKKEFTLTTDQEYNKQNVDYTLHYKAGDQNDMYFFNKYDASLRDKEMQQTFYINKGSGITAKEAYNLMEGRAVHKQLENLEGEKYNAWIIIDKENKTENGNFKLRPFTDGWNYKPERAIDKLDIVGIGEEGARDKLMKSLEKGNRHQVTAIKDSKEVKLFLEANPAEHRVNLTNWKGEAQQLEHYKKPELKNEAKKDQKQAQTTEDAPAKKPRKSAKMKV